MGVNQSIEKIGDVTAAAIEKTGNDSVEKVMARMEKNIENLLTTLHPLLSTAETAVTLTAIVASGVGFAAASASLLKSFKVLTGTDATSELLKLGVSIDKSLRTAADNLEAMNARQCQQGFHKHVYQYVNMISQGANPDTYFFVFHPGTDWYPAFHEMNTQRPLARLAGYFSDFNTMHVYLQVFRKAAGPKKRIHVLIPAEHWVFLPESIDLQESLAPIVIECEKHSSGRAYVHVNMPGVPNHIFRNVLNVTQVPPSVGKWLGSNTTGWAVGVPTTVATFVGGVLIVGATGGVAAPLVPIVLGALATTGAVTGAVAGVAARDAVQDHMVKCEEEDILKKFDQP